MTTHPETGSATRAPTAGPPLAHAPGCSTAAVARRPNRPAPLVSRAPFYLPSTPGISPCPLTRRPDVPAPQARSPDLPLTWFPFRLRVQGRKPPDSGYRSPRPDTSYDSSCRLRLTEAALTGLLAFQSRETGAVIGS